MGDRIYSTARFLRHHRRLPRFRGPETFNDRLFRLKHGGALDEPLRHYTSDKEQVKSYVAEVGGGDYVLPILGLLSGDLEVERYRVSRAPCIVKPTHLSGQVMIVRDPNRDLDRAEMKRRLAAPFRFLRVDFLVVRGEMKVGELTNCLQTALGAFRPASFDRKLGRLFSDPDWEVERILD